MIIGQLSTIFDVFSPNGFITLSKEATNKRLLIKLIKIMDGLWEANPRQNFWPTMLIPQNLYLDIAVYGL